MRRCVTVSMLCMAAFAQGQESDTLWRPSYSHLRIHDEITLLAGYHQGRSGFGELGLGRSYYAIGHLPVGWGYYAGGEMRVDRPELKGAKIGAYVTSGFAMGLQLIHYWEGEVQSSVLRPEIGIGLFKGKMTYAYNIGLSPTRVPGINTHMIGFSYAFRIMRLPQDDDQRRGRW